MFRLAAILLVFIVMVTLIVGCSATFMPATWNDWLANLKPSGMTMRSNSNAKFGFRPKFKKLEYYGGGRAELGEYSVRMFDPLTHITLRAEFSLEGQTDCQSKGTFDRFMKHNNQFFREQVNVALRACDPEELVETDVGTLERKLVTQVNRSLDRDFLGSVKIKKFALYESINKSGFVRLGKPEQDSNVASLP